MKYTDNPTVVSFNELQKQIDLLAGKHFLPIEFTRDESLQRRGGIACLLRDQSKSQTDPLPAQYASVDLVA